jgi:hypothetical protein
MADEKRLTKLEAYQIAKRIAEKIKLDGDRILKRDDTRNDKGHMSVSFTGLASGDWSDMQFRIHASYGYYGSSSGYSATSKELGGYFAKAIEAHAAMLLDHAAKLAAIDAGTARKAAEDEAREVLKETA